LVNLICRSAFENSGLIVTTIKLFSFVIKQKTYLFDSISISEQVRILSPLLSSTLNLIGDVLYPEFCMLLKISKPESKHCKIYISLLLKIIAYSTEPSTEKNSGSSYVNSSTVNWAKSCLLVKKKYLLTTCVARSSLGQ
jgi:hypothetical protein